MTTTRVESLHNLGKTYPDAEWAALLIEESDAIAKARCHLESWNSCYRITNIDVQTPDDWQRVRDMINALCRLRDAIDKVTFARNRRIEWENQES